LPSSGSRGSEGAERYGEAEQLGEPRRDVRSSSTTPWFAIEQMMRDASKSVTQLNARIVELEETDQAGDRQARKGRCTDGVSPAGPSPTVGPATARSATAV
jgi:hypothetical protein